MSKPLATKVSTTLSEMSKLGQLAISLPGVMWLVSVTRSQVWMGSRCVKLVLSLSLSHTGHWKFNMAPHGKELSEDLKKRIVALHKDGVGYKKIARPWNWDAARWPRPYSGLTGQVPLRTGRAMIDQRSWVHVLSVISRGCVWEIDVWVLPALLQRLKGWGVSLSVLRPFATHCIKLVCMAVVQKEASSKDDAQESPQTVCWRQAD